MNLLPRECFFFSAYLVQVRRDITSLDATAKSRFQPIQAVFNSECSCGVQVQRHDRFLIWLFVWFSTRDVFGTDCEIKEFQNIQRRQQSLHFLSGATSNER